MKTCSHCKQEKSLTEFYIDHTRGKPRHVCKMCDKKSNRKWADFNRDRIAENTRKSKERLIGNDKEAYLAIRREQKKKSYEKNRESYFQRQIEYINKYPERKEVAYLTHQAIAKGLLKRPSHCVWCNRKCRVSAHHEDYNISYIVIWLCQSCHTNLHQGRLIQCPSKPM